MYSHSDGISKQAMLERLAAIARQYDAWWVSPTGRTCQITINGLYSQELNAAIPWGDVQLNDLVAILADNERGIMKSPMDLNKRASGLFTPKGIGMKWEVIRT